MNSMEDLLRQTFTEHAQQVTEPPPMPATAPRRRTRGVLILAGAAAAAVLVGSTLVVNRAGSDGTPVRPSATAAAPRFTPAPITTTDGRTSAVFDWAPTWTPADPTGYEVTATLQVRFYGFDGGPYAAVAIGRGDCKSLQRMAGFAVNLRWDLAMTNAGINNGYETCRPLTRGGSLGVITGGKGDLAAAARRIADSVRTGRRQEIAVPIGFRDGTGVDRLSVIPPYDARSRWEANVTGSDGTDLYAGPAPYPLHRNQTVGGRPAEVFEKWGISIVRIMLSPTVWSSTATHDHARTFAVAAGLRLGAVPDYPWVH